MMEDCIWREFDGICSLKSFGDYETYCTLCKLRQEKEDEDAEAESDDSKD